MKNLNEKRKKKKKNVTVVIKNGTKNQDTEIRELKMQVKLNIII